MSWSYATPQYRNQIELCELLQLRKAEWNLNIDIHLLLHLFSKYFSLNSELSTVNIPKKLVLLWFGSRTKWESYFPINVLISPTFLLSFPTDRSAGRVAGRDRISRRGRRGWTGMVGFLGIVVTLLPLKPLLLLPFPLLQKKFTAFTYFAPTLCRSGR